MSVIGIDFGSSFSTVTWINPHSGKPEAVKFNGDGSVKFPSIIFSTEEGFHYGFQAASYYDEISLLPQQQRIEYLPNFIPSLKRIMDPNGLEFFFNRRYTHNQLLTSFLQNLISQAQSHCGTDYLIDNIVISHPVDFAQNKIRMIKDSLFSLGYHQVDTQYEPVSAVYGYSIDHEICEGEGILVFDFGGGTIDVAFIQRQNGELVVVTEPKGDGRCGGQDIDFALYNNLRNTLISEQNYDITNNGIIDQVVLNACRRLKEKFSGNYDVYETMILLQIDGHICNYKYRLSRDSFNDIISPIVASAIDVAGSVISDVNDRELSIDKILLIGGSSQLTIIRDMLLTKLGHGTTIETCGEKDIVVALGNIASHEIIQISEELTPDDNNTSNYLYPSEEPLNYDRAICCKNCGKERCYHFAQGAKVEEKKKTWYHCVDCGWEGPNVVVRYKSQD